MSLLLSPNSKATLSTHFLAQFHHVTVSASTNTKQEKGNFAFLASYIYQHKLSYSLGVGFLLLTTWISVSIPHHIGSSIDMLSNDMLSADLSLDNASLQRHILSIIVLALLQIFVRTVSRILFFNPGRAIEKQVKDAAFTKLTKLQKPFHDTHETGRLISIVNNDINGVRALCGVIFMQFFNIVFALTLTPYFMWQLSPALTLYCFVPVVITFYIAHKATDFLRKQTRERMTELQGLSSNTISVLSGIDVIRGNDLSGWAKASFHREDNAVLQRSLSLTKAQTLALPVIDYTDRFMKLLIIAVGGMYLIRQQISIGDLAQFLSYATLLAMPFISMGRVFSGYRIGLESVNSIRKILDLQTEQRDSEQLSEEKRSALFSQALSVRNLTFFYPGENTPALKNISFEILPGEKIGILGRVGSGKTTLVNCLNRYLDTPVGTIFLDDIDVCQLARSDLRSTLRTVTQDPFLFSSSVEENVRFGCENSAQNLSLEHTLYLCNMDKEVDKLPEKQHTIVGEKGILLSGGQKQRLSLARAFYTPCKLIVLDNVLSAVDNQTEHFLLDKILNELQSQSTLIISHRVSALENMDRILVLESGEMIAQGTHSELIESCSVYRETWAIQQRDSEEEKP